MPLAHAVVAKLAVGATAAAVVAGGVATVAVRGNESRGSAVSESGHPAASVEGKALTDGTGGMDVVVDPVTGTVRLVPRPTGANANAEATAGAKGAAGAGSQVSGGTPGRPSSTPGGMSVGAGGRTGGSAGAGGSGGSSGNGGPGGGGPGGGGGITTPGAPDLSAPAVPSAPHQASAHAQGSFTVVVPGTDRTSKKLCLSGTAANRCQTITVPALRPVELTLSFTGNAGVEAPAFTPGSCPGGASVTVSGVSPGATVTASVNGRQLSAKVAERPASQTASLCDA